MDEAFVKLFAEHQRHIYAAIRTLSRSAQDADDIFQDTVVVLWRKADEFQRGTNFLAWAIQIARFEILAHAKRHGRSKLLFDDEMVSQVAQTAAELSEKPPARLIALRDCMSRLSTRHREMIEQRYADGGSVAAIAKKLGRSTNSISVTLHTIRRKLLGCIEEKLAGGSV